MHLPQPSQVNLCFPALLRNLRDNLVWGSSKHEDFRLLFCTWLLHAVSTRDDIKGWPTKSGILLWKFLMKLGWRVANVGTFICGWHILHLFIVSLSTNHFVIYKETSQPQSLYVSWGNCGVILRGVIASVISHRPSVPFGAFPPLFQHPTQC